MSPAEASSPDRATRRPPSDGGARDAGQREEGPWTVLRLIRWSAEYLDDKGVPQGRLDAEHLLAHALGTGRLQLYLQYDRPLTPDELATFKPLLLRRAKREPLQYIVGRAAFRELDLRTDPRVLIPRPETEVLVEVVLQASRDREALTALDVGTGSGCIALSLVHEGPFVRVVATDAAADALELARLNARGVAGGERVEFREGMLYGPVNGERFDVVVSNPPYIARHERDELEPEVRDWEPAGALFAGDDGLDVVGPLVEGAAAHLVPGGLLALEVAPGQADAVVGLVDATGDFGDAEVHRDLARRPRVVAARRRE